MRAIPTEYKGYLFRSRLEARWAVFLDTLGIRWEYEPEGLILSDGTYYLPDFYLIDFHLYFEVKRKGLRYTEEGKEAIQKISDGMRTDSWAGLICFGDPMDDELIVFCQETDDGGGGWYEDGEVTIGIHPETVFLIHSIASPLFRSKQHYTGNTITKISLRNVSCMQEKRLDRHGLKGETHD